MCEASLSLAAVEGSPQCLHGVWAPPASGGTKYKAEEHEYSGRTHLKHMGYVKEIDWQIHTVDVVFGGPNYELVQPLKVTTFLLIHGRHFPV